MSRRCQATRYVVGDTGLMEIARCKKQATATFNGADRPIDLCTTHLGSTLIYGGIWFDGEDGQTWELKIPARYPLREETA